jgi:hypothetical protein
VDSSPPARCILYGGGVTTLPSPEVQSAPDYLRRAMIVRRTLTAIAVLVVLVVLAHPLFQKTPKSLDVASLPVTTVAVDHRLALTNPLDPTLASATVTSITLDRTTATVHLTVCPHGTWSPNGVSGFALVVRHGEAILPNQASPLLSVVARSCVATALVFSVAPGAEIRGVAYVQTPYVNAAWIVTPALRVARNS